MDPITQGVVGGIVAQASARTAQLARAAVIGGLGGMAADLDSFIQSAEDPMLYLEFHRQFTHSLFFIPIGGVLCGLLLYGLLGRWWRLPLRQYLVWSTLGYATHGLLDGCTSWGTLLLWPLSDHRFAWDLVSVVDGIFSLPLVILIVLAAKKQQKCFVVAAIVWAAFYLSLAAVQHHRALQFGYELADRRDHEVVRLTAKPSFGNIIVWKIIYESDETYYVDAVTLRPFDARLWAGRAIDKLDISRDFPWLDRDSQQAKDVQRFATFSDGFLAVDPADPNRIGDIRYSLLPQNVEPLWGIELSPRAGPKTHVDYYTDRDGSREALPVLFKMITE